MDMPEKQTAARSALEIVQSLAEILLEEGISFNEFNELSKSAFVAAAARVLSAEKRVSDSRVSILTGIHRKDVKRCRETTGDSSSTFSPERVKSNRAISVISAWTREPGYCDKSGQAQPLPYDGAAPSLTTLIQQYSGDMPVRAVCDELTRMGVIREENGLWHLQLPTYVPNQSRNAVFNFLGQEASNLLDTFGHNLVQPEGARRFQRSVAYDELSAEGAALFQQYSSEKSMQLLKEFDRWLAKREKQDKRARAKDPELPRVKAGVGIYYFEKSPVDEPGGEQK